MQSSAPRLSETPYKRAMSVREVDDDDEDNREVERATADEHPGEAGEAAVARGRRMSRQRYTAAVLRSLGVTASTVSGWHDAFLAAGEAALAACSQPRKLDRVWLESSALTSLGWEERKTMKASKLSEPQKVLIVKQATSDCTTR